MKIRTLLEKVLSKTNKKVRVVAHLEFSYVLKLLEMLLNAV